MEGIYMKIAPKETVDEKIVVGAHTLPQRTYIFAFGPIRIVLSLVRPDEDVVHIGGIHTDSPHPQQKWRSLEEAVTKIEAKAVDMEVKARIHDPRHAGMKGGIFAPTPYLRGGKRVELFKRLGDALNYFKGRVYAGCDVETDTTDLMITYATSSSYIVGMDKKYGGCKTPSPYTAELLARIQEEVFNRFINTITRKVSIKGASGNVGSNLVALLYRKRYNLAVADIQTEEAEKLHDVYPSIDVRPPDVIHRVYSHVYSPCDVTVALPDMQTAQEILGEPERREGGAAIIGSANDQNRGLTEIEDYLFYKRNILHLSMNGSLENGGGFIAVADELEEGGFSERRLREEKIPAALAKAVTIAEESKKRNIPPYRIVEELFLS
jgi:glutamate dehydrogenase/leucine dehydrogenase